MELVCVKSWDGWVFHVGRTYTFKYDPYSRDFHCILGQYESARLSMSVIEDNFIQLSELLEKI